MKFFRIFFLIIIIVNVVYWVGCDNKSNPIIPPIGDPPVYPQIDAYPAWSPNGTKIIYNHYGIIRIDAAGSYSVNTDSAGLWMINIDGSNSHLILKGNDVNADWRTDNKWIVYEIGGQIYKAPIITGTVDTLNIEQLTFEGSNFFPTWDPDGKWITYDSNIESPNGMNFIWKMKSDGSEKRRIANDPSNGEIRSPSWSPDGRKIVHIRYLVGVFSSEIFVMDSSGANPVRLTFNSSSDRFPQYSPDGSKIAFMLNSNIWIMNGTGGNLRQLTTNGGAQPSWSPDGQEIVYVGFTNNLQNNGTLWIMNADGSNKRQLTYGPK